MSPLSRVRCASGPRLQSRALQNTVASEVRPYLPFALWNQPAGNETKNRRVIHQSRQKQRNFLVEAMRKSEITDQEMQ